MESELLEAIEGIDFHKMEKKAIAVLGGFLLGGFLVVLTSKYINDNFSFWNPKISNRPNPYPLKQPDSSTN